MTLLEGGGEPGWDGADGFATNHYGKMEGQGDINYTVK